MYCACAVFVCLWNPHKRMLGMQFIYPVYIYIFRYNYTRCILTSSSLELSFPNIDSFIGVELGFFLMIRPYLKKDDLWDVLINLKSLHKINSLCVYAIELDNFNINNCERKKKEYTLPSSTFTGNGNNKRYCILLSH